ncbi:BTAD domain-containing putative transcriptional regulator [Actinoplanes sp. N902-109]|uniref:BTAD domain-containing putative transcriptional regulator n=1 Tax=Actinoplanes sp. (strain N902-109) TaxID=649831 RepID=UPI0003294F13|nr:BTAD domain-containing putative transcriptional regulator [Actinoplanes sp. N902-109]AGL14110.1 SARP family transcriptional regulator [Actinoplanes sp. N902-109]
MSAEPEGMDLRLLGPVRAWRDGTELPLGSARRLAVFSVLALHANRAVSREQLVTALWGENPPASATGNVYTYVSALRRVLEPSRDRWAAGQVLTSGGGTYRLSVREQDVDVFRFEALRGEAKQHRATGDRQAELTVLAAALQMWHGEPLAGVPGPFAEAQRLRLSELRLATAERHATLLIETGRLDEAIAVLRALVATYPLQENLQAMLATALQAAGRPAEAQRHAAPSPAPARTAAATAGRGPWPVPSDRASLIGRDAEIRRLRRAVAEVADGTGGSLRIEGTPGMGKSALLTVALRGATPAGCRAGWAVGDELSQRMPLGLLLECFESAMPGDTNPDLVKLLFAVAAEAVDGPSGDIVARAAELVRRAAEQAPLILVADDLQWADPLTLGVWSALHADTRELPLLLIAASRPGGSAVARPTESAAGQPADSEIDRTGGSETDRSGTGDLNAVPVDEVVTLAPLSPAAATQLIRAVAPEPLDPRTFRDMLTDAGGNPSYLRHLAAGGFESMTLSAAVGTQLASFSEEARQLLRAIAFLGAGSDTDPGCTLTELALVTDRSRDDLIRALTPAVTAGVLTAAGEWVAFWHRVVARVLHDGTPTSLRVMLHRSFASRLADTAAPPERVVAQLLAGPVPLDSAIARWLTVHIEQLAGRAPHLAVNVLQRARAQYTVAPAERLELTAWLARLLLAQGRNGAAEAGWVAARTPDPELEGEMRWVAAVSHERRAEYEAAADIARSVLREHRVPPRWIDRFRHLLTRVRPYLAGNPTVPHLSRSAIIGDGVSVIR